MSLASLTNYKKFKRYILLIFIITLIEGCVKFEDTPDASSQETVSAPTSSKTVGDKSEENGVIDLAAHEFPENTVFSFANIVKLSFEIAPSYDPNGIIHVKNNKGETFLSASVATIGYITNFDVDTTYPIRSLSVIYEKGDEIKTKKLIVKKGVVNSVVLK